MKNLFLAVIAGMLFIVDTAPAQDELVLLSPHWEGIRLEFQNAFQEHYRRQTGRAVDFKWLDVGGASDILKFIRSEFRNKPDGIGVDLFFGGGTDPYVELKRLGLLDPYRVPDEILQQIPETIGGVPLYDSEYTWYAVMMAGFGVIYNRVVLERLGLPEPHTWADLADPRLFSWVGSADPRKSGSVHMAYEIILQAYGWERGWQIMTAMGANVRGFSSSASQTPKDVAVGEVAYGLAIDSYAWAQVREAGVDKIGYVMPEALTVINGDAIAILKGADHRDVAQFFVRFALSEAGQKLLLLRQGEVDGPREFELGKFSVLPALYPQVRDRTSVQLNPFEWKSDFTYDASVGSARWSIVNDLIGTFIIDPHKNLKAVWKAAIRDGSADSLLGRIAAMPLNEEQLEQLVNEERWKDAEYRNSTINQWAALARERYRVDERKIRFARNLPAIIALLFAIVIVVYMRRRS